MSSTSPPSRWSLFTNRNFLFYWIGFLLSSFGDAIFTLTLSWMIVDITGSAIIMGTYLMVVGLPRAALMLFGGVVVDRLSPRTVMLYSDLLRGVVMVVLLLLCLGGTPPLWSLYVLGLIFGSVDAFYWPAASRLRQNLVIREQYTQMNSIITGTIQASVIVGPLVGASLLSLGGYTLGIAVNGLSFLLSALTLFAIRLGVASTSASGKQTRSIRKDLIEGLQFVWQTPILLTQLSAVFFANAGMNGASVGLPFLAQEYGVGADGFSRMSAAFGIGGVVGAVLFAVIVIKRPTPRMTWAAFFIQGLCLMIVSLTGHYMQAAVCLLGIGLASTAIQVLGPSVSQSLVPPEMMGRYASIGALLAMGSTHRSRRRWPDGSSRRRGPTASISGAGRWRWSQPASRSSHQLFATSGRLPRPHSLAAYKIALSILKQGDHPIITLGVTSDPIRGESDLVCIPETTIDRVDIDLLDSLLFTGCDVPIGAISSSPFLLAKAGILEGHHYTVGLTCEQRDILGVFDEVKYSSNLVVRDGKLLTARGRAFVEFGIQFGEILGLTFDRHWYRH
jgi:predicted MFS family arabinose efflux permease